MSAKTPVQLSPQEMAGLASLAYEISQNPKTRGHFATLAATVDPSTAGAFLDVSVDRKINALLQKIEADRQADRTALVLAKQEEQKQAVIKQYGYDDAQTTALDAIRTEFGLSDWKAAAAIYASRNPAPNPQLQPPPETIGESTWEFGTVPGPDGKMLAFNDFIKDPRKHANRTATMMITDFKRGRLPSAFHA